MTPVWHWLCGASGTIRACRECARDKRNAEEAAASANQVWRMPARVGERCGDFMQRRKANAKPVRP